MHQLLTTKIWWPVMMDFTCKTPLAGKVNKVSLPFYADSPSPPPALVSPPGDVSLGTLDVQRLCEQVAYGSCHSDLHTVIRNLPRQAGLMEGIAGVSSEVRAEHEVQGLSLRCGHVRMPEVNTQYDPRSSICRPWGRKNSTLEGVKKKFKFIIC